MCQFTRKLLHISRTYKKAHIEYQEHNFNLRISMNSPFLLVVKKEIHGKINDVPDLSESSEYRIRVTLNNTFSQLEELIILNSEDKEDSGVPCFRPIFKFDSEIVDGKRTLAEVFKLYSVQGELSVPELQLVFEYGDDKRIKGEHLKIPIPEFFVINVVSADESAVLLLSCRETLYSKVRDLKEQVLAKFRISGESSVLSYHDRDLEEDMTLQDVVKLDVPPPFVVTMSFERFPQFKTPATTYETPKQLLRDQFASELSEFYRITANGATVDISSADCIFNPEGYLLLNLYAQAKVKQELNINELVQEIPAIFTRPPSAQSDSLGSISIATQSTNTELTPTIPATAALGGNPPQREAPVEQVAVNINRPQAAPAANIRRANNNTVFQLFLREVSNNIEEIAQLIVRIALASALIGPQRALFILQPPLIYLFISFALWMWLFFYGNSISDWIELKLLENVPQNRIDYTISKLFSQIFRLAYSFSTFVSGVMSRSHTYLFKKVHYDEADIARAKGVGKTLKRNILTFVEYQLVLFLSVFPFLAGDIQTMHERVLAEEQQKMKQTIQNIAEKYSGNPVVQRRILSQLFEPLEMLLSADLPPILYQDLIRCYHTCLAIEEGL